jgi:hypothetical protein
MIKKAKNSEFDADFSDLLKNLQENSCNNIINEKVKKNEVFDFLYCVQKLSAYNFFRVNFLHFFQRIQTTSIEF